MSSPTGGTVCGGVDVVFSGLSGEKYFRVGTEAVNDGISGLGVGPMFAQAVGLFGGDGYGGAVARSEESSCLGFANALKVFKVFAFAELVISGHVAVVHQNPLVRTDQFEDGGTLHGFLGLLQIASFWLPLSAQGFGGGLLNAVSFAFGLEEHVIASVCVRIDNVSVDGVGTVVIEDFWAGEFGEVFVGIRTVNDIVGLVVVIGRLAFSCCLLGGSVPTYGIVDHILLLIGVVDGLWRPHLG